MRSRRALVVAPHHDDECIGCGGFLAKLSHSGWTTYCVTVFDSLEGANSPPGQIRLQEAQAAANILGAQRLDDLRMPCRADTKEDDITWRLVGILRNVQPEILLIPHSGERDPEHQKTHRACIEAIWLSESTYRSELGLPAPSV